MDDYCLFNRNFFEPENGFLYCMNVLKRTKPDLLINQHVCQPFDTPIHKLDSMIDKLAQAGAICCTSVSLG